MAETDIQSADANQTPAVLALAEALPRQQPSKFKVVVLALLLLNTAIVVFVGSVLLGVLSVGHNQDAAQAKLGELPSAQSQPASQMAPVESIAPALSWPLAEKAFSKGDYKLALESYRALWKVSAAIPSESNVCDYLLFRQCQCMQALGQDAPARELLAGLVHGDSPVIGGAANCLLATYEAKDGTHLQARRTAYRAIAAIGATRRTTEMLADCEFLIARCLTQEAFSLSNYLAVPSKPPAMKDPFAGLDEQSLRRLLEEGSAHLKGASLGPVVQKLPGQAFVKKYSAACAQASLEDFLNCLSAEAGVEIKWESVSTAARGRAVTLAFGEATHQQLAEVACGMAGLVARFTGDGVVIRDPADDSTTQQRELLTAEAMSAWRRIFLQFSDDPRTCEGHFSLAGLYGCAGDTNSQIGEYRLTVERFPRSQWAPEALLQSARSRVGMGDYTGAYTDLTDILDSYPGYRFTDSAYLELGNVTLKAGRSDEAIRCFLKLYYLNLSPSSRSEAALRLGQCYQQKADFKDAVEWFSVFTASTANVSANRLCEAYLMLGQCQSALGNVGPAVRAYRQAIKTPGGADTNIQAGLELAKELLKSQQYAAALACLHDMESQTLNDEQSYDYVVLNAQVLRAAGLPDRAGALLKNNLTSLSDPQLRNKATVELARCHVEAGDLAGARSLLAQTLPQMDPGPQASQAACELARVCLRGGQHEQAIAVARELLKTNCSEALAGEARKILSAAYLAQHDYENAAATASASSAVPTSAPTSAPAVLAQGYQEARP